MIHILNSTKSPVFEMESSQVSDALASDNLIDYSHYYQSLLDAEIPIIVYAGEFDAKDGPKGQEAWMKRLRIPGSVDFWTQSR